MSWGGLLSLSVFLAQIKDQKRTSENTRKGFYMEVTSDGFSNCSFTQTLLQDRLCSLGLFTPNSQCAGRTDVSSTFTSSGLHVCVCMAAQPTTDLVTHQEFQLFLVFSSICAFFFSLSSRFHYLNSSRHISAPVYTTEGESVCFYWSSTFCQNWGQFLFKLQGD